MSDNNRNRGGGRGYNNRKRRYRDDDDHDRRPQRRRYEEPITVRIRKQVLSIAESPLKKMEDEIASIAKTVAENYFDDELQNAFYDVLLQIVLEQPCTIPFCAAIVLIANTQKPEVTQEILGRAGKVAQGHIEAGSWREFKLMIRFLGLLQGLFEGDGIFPILEDLFSRAVDLQTASSDDALGLELVKIILLTIPYVLASSATDQEALALALLEKTDVITSTPHALEALVDPYTGEGEEKPSESPSIIGTLQKQLQTELSGQWELAFIPRPWKMPPQEDGTDPLTVAMKHAFPSIVVPDPLPQPSKPMFPEVYISVYADQEVETVPPTKELASSIIRDVLVDTINILDFNRNVTAKFLTNVDCYWSPGTFVKRATPFDKLKEIAGDGSTWKPEDIAVDAVFSQVLQLPTPEHKLVYYHSVLTEACKLAPAAVAPSLGRAIRFLYRNVGRLDLELAYRFMDWFAHHLSNFGFTWKWTEWVDDVGLPDIHPRNAFIIGALEKEVRLSFAQRIRGTLPEPYKPLISTAKEKDTPDFKYDLEETPYKAQAQELMKAIRKKASEEEIQALIDSIHRAAQEQEQEGNPDDVLLASTDAYVTSICYIGSKSLSHVLSCIERCKDRLAAISQASASARNQIIDSVMTYWTDQPGIGVNIIDKLLNYTILTPLSVVEWVLLLNLNLNLNNNNNHPTNECILAQAHRYELVALTVAKVNNRVRQIVASLRRSHDLPPDQKRLLEDTLRVEREEQKRLYDVVEEGVVGVAAVAAADVSENGTGTADTEALMRDWAERWLRVFRRWAAVEDAFVGGGGGDDDDVDVVDGTADAQ